MASAFANYTGGVKMVMAGGGSEQGASFSTFDVNLRYGMSDWVGPWSGMEFSLSVQNVFNKAPPIFAVATPLVAPFDSTNYSAVGRFVSVSVSKHW